MAEKSTWTGELLAVQPRIRLTRSFDQRHHSYLGYSLVVEGAVQGRSARFSVGIGRKAHKTHRFRAGQQAEGQAVAVVDSKREPVDYYKASRLKVISERAVTETGPPWQSCPPSLEVYRARGHRRLAAQTYKTKCWACIWGCRMPVEMIVDQWNPQQVRYRFETFCYGPKSCEFYRPGPRRVVPGRKGMRWEEPDWVDEDATSHRGPDE